MRKNSEKDAKLRKKEVLLQKKEQLEAKVFIRISNGNPELPNLAPSASTSTPSSTPEVPLPSAPDLSEPAVAEADPLTPDPCPMEPAVVEDDPSFPEPTQAPPLRTPRVRKCVLNLNLSFTSDGSDLSDDSDYDPHPVK